MMEQAFRSEAANTASPPCAPPPGRRNNGGSRALGFLLKEVSSPFLRLEEMFMKGASAQRVVEGYSSSSGTTLGPEKVGQGGPCVPFALGKRDRFPHCRGTAVEHRGELSGAVAYCSRIIPQVRMGMRFDVLSGLLSAKAVELLARRVPSSRMTAPAVSQPRPDGPWRRGKGEQEKSCGRAALFFPLPMPLPGRRLRLRFRRGFSS